MADFLCGIAPQCTTPRHQGVRVWVHDLPDICKTGDVVLFSTRDTGAKMIQRLTISEWNHVGMVVKPATIPYLIEWGGGLILQPLVERLHAYYADNYSRVITIRQLNLSGLDRLELEAKLEAFAHQLLTDPAREDNNVFPLDDVAKQFFTRGIRQSEPVDDNLSRLFCSKTVAVMYKHIGLLSKEVDTTRVFPKHFGRKYDNLMRYEGGKLGQEVDISFEPKTLRGITSALLHLPKSAWGALTGYERAVAILQNAARCWVAKRRAQLAREAKARDAQSKRPQPPLGEIRSRFTELSSAPVGLAVDYEYEHADFVAEDQLLADTII